MSAAQLKAYLDATGILACNTDAHLRCLEDIGCSWADAVELIEKKELFLSKVYRKRTVYLSPRVYHMLKPVQIPEADAGAGGASLWTPAGRSRRTGDR